MHKTIQNYPWLVALVGVVLLVAGYSQTWGQAANSTGKQMIFDFIAIAGWVFFIGGIVVWVKSKKAKKQDGGE